MTYFSDATPRHRLLSSGSPLLGAVLSSLVLVAACSGSDDSDANTASAGAAGAAGAGAGGAAGGTGGTAGAAGTAGGTGGTAGAAGTTGGTGGTAGAGGASGNAGSSTAGAGGAAATPEEQSCAKACEVKNKINPLIACNPSTPCMSGCLDAIAMTLGCLAEFDAMTACAAKEPPSSFKCSSKYGAQLQDTACKAASDKFFACAFGG